jgi:hypothetical protein
LGGKAARVRWRQARVSKEVTRWRWVSKEATRLRICTWFRFLFYGWDTWIK